MTYKVISGDTGFAIAEKIGLTFQQLEAANPGITWTNLQIGQTLNTPGSPSNPPQYGQPPQSQYAQPQRPPQPPSSHLGTTKVLSGDTGEAIAKRAGVSFKELSAANPGVNWSALQVDQPIQMPLALTAAPLHPLSVADHVGTSGGGPVIHYHGPAAHFPGPENWQKWSHMWARNERILQLNNTPQQIYYMKEAIEHVAHETSIDRRVILCTIMQESQGNVHVQTTISPDGRVRNPGIMQTHNGAEYSDADPRGSILQMVRDGVSGTQHGPGIRQLLDQYDRNVYQALRAYNSGSVNKHDLSDGLGATDGYVSDVANRLCGAPPN